ncbi:M24 family metallopeptidase [Bradyrhizobium zhanjiangense]|nr:Xaa-Pro peptidase family protein [Bradyrhizobium zhanjiangense]
MPESTHTRFAEHKARTCRLQADLLALGCGALFVTSEDNIQYLTGFKSPVWNNLTRPHYLIVPAKGEPILISPANYAVIAEQTTWITDVRTWVSPNPEDDGVSLVVDALRSSTDAMKKIAAELGPQSRLTMPAGDFLRIQKMLQRVEFVDGHALLMSYRVVKSASEIERIQVAATAASRALNELPTIARSGQSLYDLAQALKMRIIELGAQDVPYMVGVSGQGGYPCVNLAPDHRPLRSGDVFVFDVAARYDGYYCDFDRDYAVGAPSVEVRSAYRRLWEATEAAIDAVKPGLRMSDIWQVMAKELGGVQQARSAKVGRLGHSIGLRLCEEPSIGEADHTVIRANMVLTLEPSLVLKPSSGRQADRRIMVHEENILVTETGCRLMSLRTPKEMPIIQE